MAYTPQTWADGSAGGTPVSAARLSHIESGVQAAAITADSALPASTAAATYVAPQPGKTSTGATLLPFLNVKDFGALGDGVTDDLAAINAAVAAFGSAGGEVRYPPGNYAVSGTVLTNQDNVHHVGAGVGATKITTSSATLPIFDFGDNVTLRTFLTVRDMMLATSVTRTAAGFIRARMTADLKVERCRLDGGFIGVDLFNTQITRLVDLHIINCAPGTGAAIQADGNGSNLYIDRVGTDAPNGSQPTAGLILKQWDGVFLTDTQFNHSGTGLIVEPALGTSFTHLFASNCSFDTNSNDGVLTQNGVGGQGTIERLWFDNCWFGTNTVNGINLAAAVDGVHLIAPKVFNNGQHGIRLTNCANVHIVSPHVSGNGTTTPGSYDGVEIAAGLSQITITGGRIGPMAGFANTQQRSITIAAGAGDYITVADVDVHGNTDSTNAFSSAATGTNNVYRNLKGWSPRGHAVTQPAVPATTVAQTNATGCDCTIWVNGGTVTVVAIGGTATGATAGAFRVPAGQTITLTYTVAPTWQWFGD